MIAKFRYLLFLFLIIIVCQSLSTRLNIQKLYSLSGKAQGTTFIINYYAEDEVFPIDSIYQILDAIDSSLSQYKPYSLISKFNTSNAGVKTDKFLRQMIIRSLYFAELTNENFDITIKPLSVLWGFNASSPTSIPSKRKIQSALQLVGSGKIKLTRDSLLKMNPKVMIDLDGIAQGYTVDLLAEYLSNHGINNFLVELGGEIRTSGSKPDGSGWVIGIEGPMNEEQHASIVEKKLLISNKAITTSGNYRKFVKIKDQYFSHIINPKTGKPANNGVISVTVIAGDATTADALDNAFLVMGVESTFQLLNKMPEIGVYVLYKKSDGSIADTSNAKFQQYFTIAE